MAATKLGLYELLAPQFAIPFPDFIDEYLSVLGVDSLQFTYDDTAVVYTGTLSIMGDAGALPKREHRAPSGEVFTWDALTIPFRLTVPRNTASQDLQAAVDEVDDAGQDLIAANLDPSLVRDGRTMRNLNSLVDRLGPVPTQGAPLAAGATTDALGTAFRLELMMPELSFHLGKPWKPGVYQDHRIIIDPANPDGDVRFVLPKVVFEYQQDQGYATAPRFRMKSWGSGGFDAPADLGVGELIRMEPPIAMHESGRFAFGVDQVLLDLSQDSTPPQILEYFGTDEAWTGLFIKAIRVYYTDEAKQWGFTFGVDNALISFQGEVSFDAFVDVVLQSDFRMSVLLLDGATSIDYQPGIQADSEAECVSGNAVVPEDAYIQVSALGGVPGFTVSISYAGSPLPWDAAKGRAQLTDGLPKTGELVVAMTDSSKPAPRTRYQKTALVLTPSSQQPQMPAPGTPVKHTANWDPDSIPPDVTVTFVPAITGITETLTVSALRHNILRDGVTVTVTDKATNKPVIGPRTYYVPTIPIDVPEGAEYDVELELAQVDSKQEYFHLLYDYDRPFEDEYPGIVPAYVGGFGASPPDKVDPFFMGSKVPTPAWPLPSAGAAAGSPPSPGQKGPEALRAWLWHRVPEVNGKRTVSVDGYASTEGHSWTETHNFKLSVRRLAVAYAAVDDYNAKYPGAPVEIANRKVLQPPAGDVNTVAHGELRAKAGEKLHGGSDTETDPAVYPPGELSGKGREGSIHDRVVLLRADGVGGASAATATGTLKRDASQPIIVPPPREPPPYPTSNAPPDVFRRMSVRVRVERNTLILAQVEGELDFETTLERKVREQQIQGNNAPQKPLFNNPGDGITEFTFTYTYDPSTHYRTESLRIHAAEEDLDGVLPPIVLEPNEAGYRWKNMLGAMMLLSPILSKATGTAELDQPEDWAGMAVSWGVPALLGGLDVIQTKKLTLYGGELKARQYAPPGQDVHFSDAAVLFDYAVDFGVDFKVVKVKSSKPLRVRYKSVGFNLHVPLNGDAWQYQPIFDPSKGYELNLDDPSLFEVDGLLGDLIKVLGARVARYNPLTLEVDLGLNIDLGVVTVDELKVKWPIADPGPGMPSIIPAGVKVDVPGTLKGNGRLHLLDNGFEGSLDVTLVPLKVRIAASLGVQQVPATAPPAERVTAVFVGLTVEFPSPIILGATGLGIYGFQGLFAMHYKRLEEPRQPGDPVGPALRWLEKAEGEPARLVNSGNELLWAPEKDRWSFGVGAILGSLDGGFLTNLRGMFMLELPGPRILIAVKMTVISKLPGDLKGDVTTGLLGVLDLDFNLGQITLGVIIDFSVKELIQIKLPIELFFSWNKPDQWHLYVGTLQQPAKAEILGIIRGGGYFMIAGDEIPGFPVGGGDEITLEGVAVAAGIFASMVWGSKKIGLYLELSARADVGFSFDPFFMVGLFRLTGELNLWIISIAASAALTIKAPPAWFRGEVCGKLHLLFFEIEGCVDVEFGDSEPNTEGFPDFLNGVYLQSFAPVITAGQGGERPIDASLGNAVRGKSSGNTDDDEPPAGSEESMPVVPIDSIPVLQMLCSPRVGATNEVWMDAANQSSIPRVPTVTFTEALPISPALHAKDGYLTLGSLKCRFRLKRLSLWRRKAGTADAFVAESYGGEAPPSVWRFEKQARNDKPDKRVDLALGSRTPSPTPRALERSTELETLVESSWKSTCTPAAPPACVLWTLCDKPLGPSGKGWDLEGTPLPDPPGTDRETPPPTGMYVGELILTPQEQVIATVAEEYGDPFPAPAKVIGRVPQSEREVERLRCARGLQLPRLFDKTAHAPSTFPKPPAYNQVMLALQQRLWVNLHTGLANQVRLLLLADANWNEGVFEVRQLDNKGVLLKTTALNLAAPQVLASAADLPAQWRDPALPWAQEVTPVYDFFTSGKPEFAFMSRLLLTLKPEPRCAIVQLRCKPVLSVTQKEYTLVVGAVEVCSLAEEQRFKFESSKKETKKETLQEYVEEGEAVALLTPGSEYRLDVEYEANGVSTIEVGPGIEPYEQVTDLTAYKRSFFFRTDSHLPSRLDPYVMGLNPDTGDAFHFYDEPVMVVFNDVSTLPMLAAYNAKLQYRLRGADGRAVMPPLQDEGGNPFPQPQDPETSVDVDIAPFSGEKAADFGSPYYDTLLETLPDLPCINASGTSKTQTYVKLAAQLAPLMGYTFELLPVAIDEGTPVQIKPVEKAQGELPFFRRSFKTGRYADLHAFAEDVRGARVRHKVLGSAIHLLGMSGARTEEEVLGALMAAGEQALPAPGENTLTVYWVGDQPHAVLIDTVEPHWRTRQEPELVTVQDADDYTYDPNFKRVEMRTRSALELTSPSGHIQRFIHTTGGARTVAFFNPAMLPPPGQPGSTFTLRLHRPASSLYAGLLPQDGADLLTLQLTATPPWEDDLDY